MLGESLVLVKREDRDIARFPRDDHAARDRSISIADQVFEFDHFSFQLFVLLIRFVFVSGWFVLDHGISDK